MKLSDIKKTGSAKKIDNQNIDWRKSVNTSESIPEVETVSDSDFDIKEYIQKIESALMDYNTLNEVEDWKKETLSRWHGACCHIGEVLFKHTDILRDKLRRDPVNNGGSSNFNAYDYEKINQLLDYYIKLCNRVNKPVTTWGFSYFCGLDYDTLTYGGLTPASVDTYKRVFRAQENALTDKAIQGGGVTLIATLNHVHGWDKDRTQEKTTEVSAISASNLPQLGESQ